MRSDLIPNFSILGPYGVDLGTNSARPFTIFAHLLAEGFDEFLIQNLYASAVFGSFNYARLFVFYRDTQPFKRAVARLNHRISKAWRIEGEGSIPLDYFDVSNAPPFRSGDESWYQLGCARPDLVLLPSMMDWRHLGAFDSPPRLSLPKEVTASLSDELQATGLDPNWWFCTMAVPEDTEPEAVEYFEDCLEAARVVAGAHGATIVLVGASETAVGSLPEGVIDARGVLDGVVGQAYVMARSRFLLEVAPTAWLWLAYGLDLPWIRLVRDAMPRPLPGRGFLVSSEGVREPMSAIERGLEAMISETADCPLWRPSPRAASVTAPNRIHLPMPNGPDARLISL